MSSINDIYLSYKNCIKQLIDPISKNIAKELIDQQATFEILNGNMEIINRRNYDEFKKTTEIFLKRNFYFIVQNYIINFIINISNIHYDFYLSFFNKIQNTIISLGKIYNNNNKEKIKIIKYLEYCFKKKLNNFSLKYKIFNDNEDIQTQGEIIFESEFLLENFINDEKLITYKNSDSFIYNTINNNKYNYESIEEINFNEKNLCINNLNRDIMNFLNEIKCQFPASFKFDDNDITFNFFLNEIMKQLLNYINQNKSGYFEKLKNKIDLFTFSFRNNCYNKCYGEKEIEEIIKKLNLESSYKNDIHNSLINNYNQNLIQLDYITIILTGRSGVGKSTLINCFLKNNLAKTGVYNVVTMKIQSYKVKFLNFIDTRGYEINENYTPDNAKSDVLKEIESRNANKNHNELIHSIWFCVNNSSLEISEIKALKELKNNAFNIPLIVVFTNAQKMVDINNMKTQVNELFINEDIFITVLAKGTERIDQYGLDDLLNKTLSIIKLNNKNKLFEILREEYINEEKNNLFCKLENIEKDINNQIVRSFINNYTFLKDENEFIEYIYEFIEKIVSSFLNNYNENYMINGLIKSEIVNRFIRLSINSYLDSTQTYINEILIEKSLNYLDMQVYIERLKNISILNNNKLNREKIKKLISQFLKDNFYFLGQKYVIYTYINNFFKDLTGNFVKIIKKIINNILEQDVNIQNEYSNIYTKTFENFEKKLDNLRDENHNIYSLKINYN